MRLRYVLGAAVAVAGAVALASVEEDKCSLDPDGRVILNGGTMSEYVGMSEGEPGDTVMLYDIEGSGDTPIAFCEFES